MSDTENNSQHEKTEETQSSEQTADNAEIQEEIGGPAGLEPTRYGDWERKGRCIDF